MFYLTIFLGIWITVAIVGFAKKQSATMSIGGGLLLAFVGLAFLLVIFEEKKETQTVTNNVVKKSPVVKPVKEEKTSKKDLLIGEWQCRNRKNYLHKVVYKPDGTYESYDSGVVPGVASNMPISSVGVYTIDRDVLRRRYKDVNYNIESDSNVIIKKLNNAELEVFYQEMNSYESCFKPIE